MNESAFLNFLAAGNPPPANVLAQLNSKAIQALATNDTFLGLPDLPANPTNAQVVSAVRSLIDQDRALARQNNALIRLLLGALDDISDT